MSERTRLGGPDTLVHVEGVVDAMVAWQLGAIVAQCKPGSRLVLDFSHARGVADLGLAVLARGLMGARMRDVALRGLSQHHERLLRYFGVELPLRVGDQLENDESREPSPDQGVGGTE